MLLIYMNTVEWGGVDVVVERFSGFLEARGVNVAIVDNYGSRLRERLPSAKFLTDEDLREIRHMVRHIFLPSIAKLNYAGHLLSFFPDASVYAWVVQPNDVFKTFFPFSGRLMDLIGYRAVSVLRGLIPRHRERFDELFKAMVESNALSVMDGACARALSYFVPELDPISFHVIPVPSPLSCSDEDASAPVDRNGDEFSIGYLGRMDIMKWSAVKSFVQFNLAYLARGNSVAFHVISEGAFIDQLRELCACNNIRFISYGYRPNEIARRIIRENTNLAVAMGTSALDIAGTGHPCIIIDPATTLRAPPQLLFRYVHEIEEFTLGEFRDFPGYVKGMRSLEHTLDAVSLDRAGALGRQYVGTHHDPEVCFSTLLERIQGSQLRASVTLGLVGELTNSFSRAKKNAITWFR